VTDVIKDLNL